MAFVMEKERNYWLQLGCQAVGLCVDCVYARETPHPRGGASYWRCLRAEEDAAFHRYPRLPVLDCPGYTTETIPIEAPKEPWND